MWDVDGDEGNVCFAVLGSYDRSYVFVGLELDYEVDFLPDQQVCISLGDFRVVAIVQTDQFDALGSGSPLQAIGDVARELVVSSLRGIAKTIQTVFEWAKSTLG